MSNPLLFLVIMTDIIMKIKEQFRSLALRVDFINEQIMEKTLAIFEQIYEPEKIEAMLV